MARNLQISSEMQKCFKECIPNEDYGALRECWKDILWVPDLAKDVKLPNNHHAQFMAEEMGNLLNYLISYEKAHHYRWEVLARSREQLESVSDMYEEIGLAILNKNWESFFKKYRDTVDNIIREAKEQKCMDFSIEHNGNWYETLDSWFLAKNTVSLKMDFHPPVLYFSITEGMILFFEQCTLMKYYERFYKGFRWFLTSLDNALKNHSQSFNECSDHIKFLAQNLKSSFEYLMELDAPNLNAVTPEDYEMSLETIQLRIALKRAFLNRDWSEFYQRYRWDFIEIIRVAREQKVFELKVETEEGKYERFEDWDNPGKTQTSTTVNDPYHPENGKGNGTMLRSGVDDYSTIGSFSGDHGGKARSPSPPVEQVGAPKIASQLSNQEPSPESTKSTSTVSSSFAPSKDDRQSENHGLTVGSDHTEPVSDQGSVDPDNRSEDTIPRAAESPRISKRTASLRKKREDSDQDVLVEGFVNVPPQNGNSHTPNVKPPGPVEAERTAHVLDTSQPSTDAVSSSAAPTEEGHFDDDSTSRFKRGSSSMMSMVKRQLERIKLEHAKKTDAVVEEESEDVDDYHQSEQYIAIKKRLEETTKLLDTLRQVEEEEKLNNAPERHRTPSEEVTSSDDFEERLRAMKEQFAKELREKKEERRRTTGL